MTSPTATNINLSVPSGSIYDYLIDYDNLLCDTTYYYKAYIVNNYTSANYGVVKTFRRASNGLDEVNANNIPITLYPNPTNKDITISSTARLLAVEVYSLIGQKVYEQQSNSTAITIDVSTFAQGSYIAAIHTDKGIVRKKFEIVD
jgi:hypothetical protein